MTGQRVFYYGVSGKTRYVKGLPCAKMRFVGFCECTSMIPAACAALKRRDIGGQRNPDFKT